MTENMWMVRAGRGGDFLEEFLESQFVALGFDKVGDLTNKTRDEVVAVLGEMYPEYKKRTVVMCAGMLYRFASEIREGDWVITYDSSRRIYHLGQITSGYRFTASQMKVDHQRAVTWLSEVDRDNLSTGTRNTLGSIAAFFQVSSRAAEEIRGVHNNEPVLTEDSSEEEDFLFEDLQSRSKEFIKDKLERLAWDEMQDLVAALLRAMGYKTKVSAAGPDRGKDIVASPDGFGFESPRIVVEVKHRTAATGAELVRSFLGGRHKDDKGLYVSTGGFSKDARYEADRAAIPLVLMDLDDLAESLLEHYEALDTTVKTLIPLAKIYWPVD